MAYDMSQFTTPESTDTWLEAWAAQSFGAAAAPATVSLMNTYGKLIVRRKYELLSNLPFVYSTTSYDEAQTILDEWKSALASAQAVYDRLPASTQTSFFEMVLHPILAGGTVEELYIEAAYNALYAQQGRVSANSKASAAVSAFAADASITAQYHALEDGKWDHMMDQVHIGYTTWSDPATNIMPNLSYVSNATIPAAGIMGVSVQGSNNSAPGDPAPVFQAMNRHQPTSDVRYVDVYARANGSFEYCISWNASYVKVTPSSGTIVAPGSKSDVRALITVDWERAPKGLTMVNLAFKNGNVTTTNLLLPVDNTQVPKDFHGFVESNGALAIEPEHYTSVTSSSSASYVVLPNYGRTLSAVTLMPITAPSQSTADGPKLSYDFYAFTENVEANVTIYLASSLNFDDTRPLLYAVAVDDGPSTTIRPVPEAVLGTDPTGWTEAVESDSWITNTTMSISAGSHTLNVWALEPGVVIQRIVIDLGGLLPSYLGPPESVRV